MWGYGDYMGYGVNSEVSFMFVEATVLCGDMEIMGVMWRLWGLIWMYGSYGVSIGVWRYY